MASVDKVQVSGTKYDLAPSASGTLSSSQYSSGDSSSVVVSTGWTESSPIIMSPSTLPTNDSNSSIFTKVTTMIKNVRWLYAKLGTTDFSSVGTTVSGALNNLQNNKSPKTHSHTTETLPVSNTQVNSDAYVPTSSLVYSMNETLTDIVNDSTMGDDLISTVSFGEIRAGTRIYSVQKVKDVLMNIMYSSPNTRYESKSLGTWSTTSDVDTFCSEHNHDNGYTGLKLGNYVTISDGTYNVQWEIAGFDLEYNQTAADGTVYNNGYGILMIPKTQVTEASYAANSVTHLSGYTNAKIHTTTLPAIATNLQSILGSHMINRNVLLSSECTPIDEGNDSSAYTWTTSYLTLLSVGQLGKGFGSFNNKYDDGEANYKLPVFNFVSPATDEIYWTRNIRGVTEVAFPLTINGYAMDKNGQLSSSKMINTSLGIRPLMLLR